MRLYVNIERCSFIFKKSFQHSQEQTPCRNIKAPLVPASDEPLEEAAATGQIARILHGVMEAATRRVSSTGSDIYDMRNFTNERIGAARILKE